MESKRVASKGVSEMEKKEIIDIDELDPRFKYEIASQPGGEHFMKCVQCATCSSGCPVASVSEKFNPRRIIRMAVLGLKDRVLEEDFVWYCAACYTCSERCPQDVRIPDVMSAIRNVATKEGFIHPAYKEQGRLIGEHGRLYEITDFENERRGKLGLPEVEEEREEIVVIYRTTGMDKVIG
ncbi:MAG: 4Fe-4S dicluster domain-containing protein [Theionarchaea archaeon]|nr:4Fe-4S dicluster domain-containing protein [Theionarchaea archaeon]